MPQEDIKPIDRSDYASMDEAARLKIIRDLRVYHPRFNRALEIMRLCHKSKTSGVGLQCAIIEGLPGVGKSELIKAYLKDYHEVTYSKDSTIRKILSAEISSPAKINSFVEDMLAKLGDYNPTSGTRGNKNTRLVELINDCGVELIILDEFQHFMNRHNQKVNYEVADCFKSIINRTNVPVVLFGIQDDAYTVIKSNSQLKDRFSIRFNLNPFGLEDNERVREFRMLLHRIDDELPFLERSNLADPAIFQRLYDATNGVMRPLMKLIGEAASNAIMASRDRIELEDFKQAMIMHNCLGTGKNPFAA
ncbi:TniB family NTP-binding protein [Paenibacillus albus]|uniref:AAA family ATPase n=1 Tax=Paenibacillus albus TaxID=2495582 RepID=A0A3S9A3X2_9BACL|nr:TniB family NTP-binding protein [Paenibacillus albus]AZN40416.1 hypothetical protein EJC50_12710 [Paenibacillus albus]